MAALGLFLIAAQTLRPADDVLDPTAPTPFWCLACGDLFSIDLLLNVLLFMPFGAGCRLAGLSSLRVISVVLAVTASVEGAQAAWIVGRTASLSDLVSNSVGGAAGSALAARAAELVLPDATRARWLCKLGATLWVLAQVTTSYAVQPALPGGAWFALVPPTDVYLEDFRGTVRSASIDGTAIRDGNVANPEELRRSALERGIELSVEGSGGPVQRPFVSFLSLFDPRHGELFALGRDEGGIVFRYRAHAVELGLRSPALTLPGRAAAHDRRPFRAWARLEPGSARVGAEGSGHRDEVRFALSPSWGWALLLPFESPLGPAATLPTMLWIAGLLAPVAYWAARWRSFDGGWSAVTWVGGAMLIGLGGVPALFDLPAVAMVEWLGAFGGIASGSLLGSMSTRRWGR